MEHDTTATKREEYKENRNRKEQTQRETRRKGSSEEK
jgi:hypothetical protein